MFTKLRDLPRLDTWQDLEFPVCFMSVCACAFGDAPGELRTVQGDFFAASNVPAGLRAYTLDRWDLPAHRLAHSERLPSDAFKEPDYPSFPIALDRAGRRFVAATGRQHVALFEVSPYAIVARHPLAQGARVVAALGDACLAVTATGNGSVAAVDVQTGATRWTRYGARWLGSSADDALGVIARAASVEVIDLGTGDTVATVTAPDGDVIAGSASADARTLVVATRDGALWLARDGAWARVRTPETEAPGAVVVSPSGHRAVTTRVRDTYMVRTRRMVFLALPEGGALAAWDEVTTERPAFSRDEGSLVFGRGQAVARLSVQTGVAEDMHAGHAGAVGCVAVARSGRVASGDSAGVVRVWVPGEASADTVLEGHAADVTAVAFSPDATTLASSDRSGLALLWDLSARAERATLDDPIEHLWPDESAPTRRWRPDSLAFSPDGRHCASLGWTWGKPEDRGASRTALVVWEVPRGRVAWSGFLPHSGWAVRLIGFDARGVVLAWANGTLEWRDPRAGTSTQAEAPLEGKRGASVRALDGDLGVAVTRDAVIFWRLSTGAIERKFARPKGFTTGHFAASPDGAVLVGTNEFADEDMIPLAALDGRSGKLLGRAAPPLEGDLIKSLALSHDARSAVIGTRRGAVLRYGIPGAVR